MIYNLQHTANIQLTDVTYSGPKPPIICKVIKTATENLFLDRKLNSEMYC